MRTIKEQAQEEGCAEGEAFFTALVQKMATAGEADKIIEVAADKNMRNEYYRKYGIQNTVAL